jgi:glyoxylase I family protein
LAGGYDGLAVYRKGSEAEKASGIGGFFFRSNDPKTLAKWYADNLGVSLTPSDYTQSPWTQESGPTVFQPFPKDTKYFHGSWMINLRVQNLDAMAAQLRAAGITVDIDPKSYPNGRFATLHDPEENPIQLWEMKVPTQEIKK